MKIEAQNKEILAKSFSKPFISELWYLLDPRERQHIGYLYINTFYNCMWILWQKDTKLVT
jgi:hypothetical protein